MRAGLRRDSGFCRTGNAGDLLRGMRCALVLTQPDRPAGRGMTLQPSAVKTAGGGAWHRGVSAADTEGCSGAGKNRRRTAGRHGGRRLRPDPAAGRARHCRASAASISMPRCCRAGAGRRRSSARCSPAIVRPASASCRWSRVSIPGRCCCEGICAIEPGDTSATLHDRLADLGARLVVEALAGLPMPATAAADRGGHLRSQDRQGGGAYRLVEECAGSGSPYPCLQSVSRSPGPARRPDRQAVACRAGWRFG